MEPRDFRIAKVEYLKDLLKQTMILTLAEPDQVRKCFQKKSRIKNNDISVQQHWPHSSFNRRQALFKLMREAKVRKPGFYYTLRLGFDDLVVHEKEPGGYYRPVPLQQFCILEDLPPLGANQERALGRPIGRDRAGSKRLNSTPVHKDQTASKQVRNDISDESSDEETVETTVDITVTNADRIKDSERT